MVKKKWTIEEDKVLVQAVKVTPHNLSLAFKQVAEKLDRSDVAVSCRWYEHVRYNNVCFMTFSEKKECRNLKNYTPKRNSIIKPDNVAKGLWSKVKSLLGVK